MTVYTELSQEKIQKHLKNYEIGDIVKLEPIKAGTINTNYYIHTNDNTFVLTLFEKDSANYIAKVFDFCNFLLSQKLLVTTPVKSNHGKTILELDDKPCALLNFIPGETVEKPSLQQISNLGAWLGKMHNYGLQYQDKVSNFETPVWRQEMYNKIYPLISEEQQRLLKWAIEKIQQIPFTNLPQGMRHSDLFRDNVIFEEDKLSGVIDFYMCTTGNVTYDLVLVIQDWCFDDDLTPLPKYKEEFLRSYTTQRKITEIEHENWLNIHTQVAARFWLGRLHDKFFPRPSQIATRKNPVYCEKLMNLIYDKSDWL